MNVAEDSSLDEKARAEQIVENTPRPSEIESFTVRLQNDWSGDPSLYVSYRIKQDAPSDEAFIRRLADYTSEVQTKILHSGITRFPYLRLERED